MRCARCSRPLLREPAAEVKTRAGVIGYGRTCAERMGLLEPKRRPVQLSNRYRPRQVDPRQVDWVGTA